jgi:GNAT superfamily N-acetyltransferase
MSSVLLEPRQSELRIVDLDSIRPSELEGFFRSELALWRDRLSWDVSSAVTAFQRPLERGGVQGKAIRCGSSTAGYGYFLIESGRGVLTGLAVAPEWRGRDVGPLLVRAMIQELVIRGVSRIESQFLSFDAPWLEPCFESEGFESFTREFRRVALSPRSSCAKESLAFPDPFVYRTWKSWNLTEASQVMRSAHVSGVDAG